MTRANNDYNIKKAISVSVIISLRMCQSFFKSIRSISKYFSIDMCPAAMNDIQCQDVGPRVCGRIEFCML